MPTGEDQERCSTCPRSTASRRWPEDGQSVAGIARELAIDEKTVRKYLKQEDFSPRPPEEAARPSKLDPHKSLIDTWLEEDQGRWHKQRHTAKRIHDRLKAESPGYDCAYNAVQRYVKDALRAQRALRASQELVWHPGESQCDFGEADFRERGELVRKKYLTLSFPYSNDSYTQVFGGETAECVCQGLKDIFGYLGGVSPVIVFDNATGVGRRVGEVIHEAKLFHRMRAHYGFSVRFCNPESGHEKGNVESKIGYTRRNLFVPEPEFDDVEAYNRELLDLHADKAAEAHYKKLLPIRQLFEADRAALMPLPRMPFDAVRYEYIKADGYGKVRIDARHHYSTCPEYCRAGGAGGDPRPHHRHPRQGEQAGAGQAHPTVRATAQRYLRLPDLPRRAHEQRGGVAEQRDQGTGPGGAQGGHGQAAEGRAAGHPADDAPPDGHVQLRDGLAGP